MPPSKPNMDDIGGLMDGPYDVDASSSKEIGYSSLMWCSSPIRHKIEVAI